MFISKLTIQSKVSMDKKKKIMNPSFGSSFYVITWASVKIIVNYNFADFILYERSQELSIRWTKYDFTAGKGALKTRLFK